MGGVIFRRQHRRRWNCRQPWCPLRVPAQGAHSGCPLAPTEGCSLQGAGGSHVSEEQREFSKCSFLTSWAVPGGMWPSP